MPVPTLPAAPPPPTEPSPRPAQQKTLQPPEIAEATNLPELPVLSRLSRSDAVHPRESRFPVSSTAPWDLPPSPANTGYPCPLKAMLPMSSLYARPPRNSTVPQSRSRTPTLSLPSGARPRPTQSPSMPTNVRHHSPSLPRQTCFIAIETPSSDSLPAGASGTSPSAANSSAVASSNVNPRSIRPS